MNLGWIDFSDTDRKKALSVIALLKEPGMLDELGIGTLRDRISDCFFPGTSTLQTRARYFLLVPYLLRDAGSGKYGEEIGQVLEKLDRQEKACAKNLAMDAEHRQVGVIGGDALRGGGWVERKPSDIYWNGIKRLQILTGAEPVSIREYLEESLRSNREPSARKLGNRRDRADGEGDDPDAWEGGARFHWNLPEEAKGERVRIKDPRLDLTRTEAEFLRDRIQSALPGTLFAWLLEHHIDVSQVKAVPGDPCSSVFEVLYREIREELPEDLRVRMELAVGFLRLVYLSRVRYNVQLSQGKNEKAVQAWEICSRELPGYASVDLTQLFHLFDTRDPRQRRFLQDLQKAFLAGRAERADEIIRDRERRLKGPGRARLLHPGAYPEDHWYAGEFLDFRFTTARRIIQDIYTGEGEAYV